jgi:RNA polymerase sigma-70 factor (ECF subfamily)
LDQRSEESSAPSARRGGSPIPPDEELVRRTASGEAEAFEPLVRRHLDTVVRFAHHMLGDFQAAEDVAQETFLKAYAHAGRLEDPAKFTTWLCSITRHLCLDWIRARRPGVSVETLEGEGLEVADAAPAPERGIETDELHGRVLEALQGLRPDYREIVLMKHVYELSYKQISEMVGLSVSAVGEKLSRVRQMLRKRLRLRRTDSEAKRAHPRPGRGLRPRVASRRLAAGLLGARPLPGVGAPFGAGEGSLTPPARGAGVARAGGPLLRCSPVHRAARPRLAEAAWVD